MIRRSAPPLLLLVLGVVTLQLVRTSAYLQYVKPGLGPWLVVTGAVLALVGAAGVFAAAGSGPAGPAPSQVGWLLVVPVGLVVLVAPPALGSYGLEGRATPVAAPVEALGALPPPRDGAVELTLREYSRRVLFEPAGLAGARLRLLGFAVPATTAERQQHGDGFYLTRIALNCCAADGQAVRVFVRTDATPPTDTWWSVEGHAPGHSAVAAPGGQPDVLLDEAALQQVEAPTNPYTF